MKSFSVAALCLVAVAMAQRTPPQRTPSHRTPSQHNPPPPPPPPAPEPSEQPPSNTPPEVNWGKCPQLEPTLVEQRAKGEVIEQCLEKHPLSTESTPSQEKQVLADEMTMSQEEEVEAHRETITTCALEAEGWFNTDGTYKFERAKKEIEGKNLKVASDILLKHDDCTKEAKENFPDRNIQQVQLYQACMDYHITKICDIQITAAEPTEE